MWSSGESSTAAANATFKLMLMHANATAEVGPLELIQRTIGTILWQHLEIITDE